jgi:hypothetical protein
MMAEQKRLVLAGILGLWAAAPLLAAPTPAAILNFKPRQDGIHYTTPEADKIADCKVELVKARKGSGWLLRDADGKSLRLFFDTNDDNKIDVWSYYRDGVEVYREIDSDYQGRPNQYRWLNSGGTKWGLDENRDGKVDSWKVISPEEVSQEVLAALAAKDYERFKAVLVQESELKSLELPAEHGRRIKDGLEKVEAKFGEACAKIATGGKVNWVHLETVVPQCLTGDKGSRAEILRHTRGTILYEVGGKNDWVQTGEMILVGQAWRLTDGPTPGATVIDPDVQAKIGPNAVPLEGNPELAKFVEELTTLDKAFGTAGDMSPAASAKHHLVRADLLEKIVGKVKPTEREPWIRQVADSLSTAAQSGDETGLQRLQSLVKQLVEAMPGHNLTAYVVFREMQAEYARKIGTEKNFADVQTDWLERLGKFVSTYPKADDAADALLQCGMVSEFLNKEVEAKNWYGQLVKAFPDKPQGVKAAGAVRRLDLEGKSLTLSGPLLNDPNTNFDLEQFSGKIVIVYYWASWNSQCLGDFAKLKLITEQNTGKVELVSVNLDDTADKAKAYLARSPVPGTHLHQPGGLEGALATQYGVMVLPNVFLVGKDAKVVNKAAQIANVEEEIKKLLK